MIEIGIVAPLVGLGGLVATLIAYLLVARLATGTEKMQSIAEDISMGAMTFMKAEYVKAFIFVLVAAGLAGWGLGPLTAVSLIIGAVASALAGLIAVRAATKGNVRSAAAAKEKGLSGALLAAFNSGSVAGLAVASLGLAALGGLFYAFAGEANPSHIVVGFALGTSSIAIFARVAGGIFTKAADVGADLVGKLEAGIPEDDPRNPGVIADNVGDNVGNVAGMSADIFESYAGALVAAMAIAASLTEAEVKEIFPTVGKDVLLGFPLLLAAIGLGASILGILCMNLLKKARPTVAITASEIFTCVVFLGGVAAVALQFDYSLNLLWAVVVGSILGLLIGKSTQFYISARSAKRVAESARAGAATNVISGFAVGLESCGLPLLLIALSVWGAWEFAGLYGIAIAAVSMLSTVGLSVTVDAYGPIVDNAGGIAEMAHLGSDVRTISKTLNSVGNNTTAVGKGFAIGATAMTSLSLFVAFKLAIKSGGGAIVMDIADPRILIGMLIGAFVVFFTASQTMKSVGKAGTQMVEEIRRQFREIPGLLNGTGKPDTARCIEISTQAALKEMILPVAIIVLTPLAVGFGLDATTLGGVVAGSIFMGVVMAFLMANAGGVWANAKKYIENGHLEGEKIGSDAHGASVVGDAIGDPFKDTSGPALNVLIKLIAVIAVLIAPLL